MELAISILDEQKKISEERLKINHYPHSVEPIVKKKIDECEKAILILRAVQKAFIK